MTGKEMWLYDDFYDAFWNVYDTIFLSKLLRDLKEVEEDIAYRRTFRMHVNEGEKRFFVECGRCVDGDHGECLNLESDRELCACDHNGGFNELRMYEVPQRGPLQRQSFL